MGKASNRKQQMREIRAQVTAQVAEAVTGEPKKQSIVDKMKATANGMKEDIKSRMGNEIIMGAIKLVKQDIKKNKVKDAEQYIAECKNSLRPGTKAGNMMANSGVSWEEMEATIRVTLKENYVAKA